jgi:hypothetical protein
MGQRSQTERLASVMQDLVMKYSFKIGRNKLQLLFVIQMKSYMTKPSSISDRRQTSMTGGYRSWFRDLTNV